MALGRQKIATRVSLTRSGATLFTLGNFLSVIFFCVSSSLDIQYLFVRKSVSRHLDDVFAKAQFSCDDWNRMIDRLPVICQDGKMILGIEELHRMKLDDSL